MFPYRKSFTLVPVVIWIWFGKVMYSICSDLLSFRCFSTRSEVRTAMLAQGKHECSRRGWPAQMQTVHRAELAAALGGASLRFFAQRHLFLRTITQTEPLPDAKRPQLISCASGYRLYEVLQLMYRAAGSLTLDVANRSPLVCTWLV